MDLSTHLDRALKDAGIPIDGVSVGDRSDRATWRVSPTSLQSAAQPIIDAFDPDDPSVVRADADQEVDGDDRFADFLEALITNWGAIGALVAAGKTPQALAQIKSTWRAKRRARKGV